MTRADLWLRYLKTAKLYVFFSVLYKDAVSCWGYVESVMKEYINIEYWWLYYLYRWDCSVGWRRNVATGYDDRLIKIGRT